MVTERTRRSATWLSKYPRVVCFVLPLCADFASSSCPVCGVNLVDIGPAPLQEAHVRNCLEGGGDASTQSAKYLVYKLPEESALIGTECGYSSNPLYAALNVAYRCHLPGRICERYACALVKALGDPLSSFVVGSTVARLSCLCSFHNGKHTGLYLVLPQLMYPKPACHLGCRGEGAAPSMLVKDLLCGRRIYT